VGDAAAITETLDLSQPNLADKQTLKKIRFSVKNQRDSGAASAVGAATVAVSLLIGDGKVTLDAFYVLIYAQGALMYVAQVFTFWSARLMHRDMPRFVTIAMVSVATALSGSGVYLTSQLKKHESNVGSSSWWWLLGLAALGALVGLIIRRSADSLLDELDDESWKQRVAPLVNKQG
jgi:MYXO-CTERM domain-containing protein